MVGRNFVFSTCEFWLRRFGNILSSMNRRWGGYSIVSAFDQRNMSKVHVTVWGDIQSILAVGMIDRLDENNE